jgi:hypothetical protein
MGVFDEAPFQIVEVDGIGHKAFAPVNGSRVNRADGKGLG